MQLSSTCALLVLCGRQERPDLIDNIRFHSHMPQESPSPPACLGCRIRIGGLQPALLDQAGRQAKGGLPIHLICGYVDEAMDLPVPPSSLQQDMGAVPATEEDERSDGKSG